jgi:hypothetical protein
MHCLRCLFAPLAAALLAAFILAPAARPASARLLIEIDKSSQTMTVSRDGAPLHRWPVSTGLRAYDTPSGSYTPFRLEEDHFSREWDDAPMPHSIFFTKKGHAIHGTTHLRAIGRPASHGCVRLEPGNARRLFGMVKREGLPNVRVVLRGVTPSSRAPAVARPAPQPEPEPGFDPRSVPGAAPGFDPRFGPGVGPGFEREPGFDREAAPAEPPRPPGGIGRPGQRAGYWVIHPDGSRVFVDRERIHPFPPPPPFLLGPPGMQ